MVIIENIMKNTIYNVYSILSNFHDRLQLWRSPKIIKFKYSKLP